MKVTNILCEYLRNPLGLGIRKPRINWNLEGVKEQKSFEIIYKVNGVEATTGEIASSSMHYDFEHEFSSRDRVEYTIKVTSVEGVAVSEENFFEIGIIESDWTAKWITGDYKAKKNARYPVDCFRKGFAANNIVKARLYVTAHGIYEASINDKRVGTFVLAPGSTDYRKRVQYQAYDVLELLKDGENTISFLLADGWYRGSIGAKGFTCVFGTATSLLAQLELTDKDGNVTVINSDSSFEWSNDGPITFADLKDGEVVDANKEPSYKGHAKEIKVETPITASNNTFVEEKEVFSPIGTVTTPKGKKVIEFKQNLAGIISFDVMAHKGDVINLRLGEMFDKDGEFTLHNVQCVRKGKRTPLQEIHYICKEGMNHYKSKFCISGFKLVEVDSTVEIKEEDIHQIALYSHLDETSSFECSNELINILTRNTLWSLKSNSADVPTDCPTRERMGWTGDSQVFFNTAAYLTNYAAFSRKHLVDVFDRQDKNGRLPQIAPYNAEDWFMDVMNGSVGWADVGVLMPWRFYLRYGDKRILEQYYDDMVRYGKFMIKRCGGARGIYAIYAKPVHLKGKYRKYGVNNGQSYGEWAEPNDIKPFVWTDFCEPHPEESTAYTSWVLGLIAKIGKLLGKEEDVALFEKYSEGTKYAYQELITTPRHDINTTIRQAKLVRPLYMNLLTEEQEEAAKKRLLEVLEGYGWRLGTGFLSTPFIMDVLCSYDVEAAYRLLENEEMPGWLYMSKNDTGTIWEGWEGPTAQLGISSLNHYSKGAVVEWFFHGMCGINIEGENSFLIKPVVGGKETYAKARYDSIYGTVASSWEKDGDKIKFNVTIPSNTKAEFVYKDTKLTLEPGTHSFEC